MGDRGTVRLGDRAIRVGKILCVGRNYVDHAREMGVAATREELAAKPPFFFLKPPSALAPGGVVALPAGVGTIHHEAELAVLVGRTGRRIRPEDAMRHVAGYAAFLDLTARDVQAQAKASGLPWTLAKGMDGFAPCGAFAPPSEGPLPIRLVVNGDVRQSGSTADMVHDVASLLAHASRWMTLDEGDVVSTGTPAGVGPVAPGDEAVLTIGRLPELRVRFVAEAIGELARGVL